MNIRKHKTNSPALLKLPTEYVENPAVLADTLLKKAPIQLISSVILSSRVPTARRITLVERTIFELKESFLNLLFFFNIQDNKKTNSSSYDQKTSCQIKQYIILIRDQISETSQNIKTSIIKRNN